MVGFDRGTVGITLGGCEGNGTGEGKPCRCDRRRDAREHWKWLSFGDIRKRAYRRRLGG
jgi:hypothetical protein